MPVIKYKKILEDVLRKPVFTVEDLQKKGLTKGYSKKLLSYLSRAGRVKRIERGKYTTLDDPVAVAAHIATPCYLSLWTAMSIRNLTDQIPFAVEVVTSRKRFKNRINFEGTYIIFYTVSARMMFGYENIIWKGNIRIAVANAEKIIIDSVHFNNIPQDEIKNIIKHSDISLLKKYAKLTGNKRVMKRIKELYQKCSQKER